MSGTITRRKLRRQARTLPIKGQVDARGKSYRCWNCDFVCHENVNALAGPDSSANVIPTDYIEKYPQATAFQIGTEGMSADGVTPLQFLAISGGAMGRVVTLELGPDGEPKPLYHAHRAKVTSGCPFCGTKNWRGDYP